MLMRQKLVLSTVLLWGLSMSAVADAQHVFAVDRRDDDPAATACRDEVPNDCSLRGAIIAANGSLDADTITLPALPPGESYVLTLAGADEDRAATGDLDIRSDLTIAGAGAAVTIIDGNGLDHVIHVLNPFLGRITVTISGVTVQNGGGRGIVRQSSVPGDSILHLVDCVIRGNAGGVYSSGGSDRGTALTMTRCTVTGNTASIEDGGGINNSGVSATLELTDSTVSGNDTVGRGGGLFNTGSATVVRTVVRDNTAAFGGGIGDFGTLTLTDSTVSDNSTRTGGGGGVVVRGEMTVTGSTISHNRAGTSTAFSPHGGGFLLDARASTLTVANSTISGNRARGYGGAIALTSDQPDTLNLRNTTITDNAAGEGIGDGGGIFNSVATVNLANTIIAANTGVVAPDCLGPLISEGFNLIEHVGGCSIGGDATGNVVGLSPGLGPLASNGGPTQTHALLLGSPAIDRGSPAAPGSGGGACEPKDQRGVDRPADGDGNGVSVCDVGAVEAARSSTPLRVTGIVPNRGGNTGSVLAIIQGEGLATGASVKLVRSGEAEIVGAPGTDDGGVVAATGFDLTARSPGLWDVVVTNPDGTSATLPQAFTIEEGREPQLWVDVVGPQLIRLGRPARFYIVFGNRGNVDALAVPLELGVSANVTFDLRSPIAPPPPQAGQVPTDWSGVPIGSVPDEVSGLTFIPLLLPVVPAGSTGMLWFTVTALPETERQTFHILSGIGRSSLQPELDPQIMRDAIARARLNAESNLGVAVPPELDFDLEQYLTGQLQGVVARGRDAWMATVGTKIEVYSRPQLEIDLARFAAARAQASPH
jgi:hypothetical protein